MQSYADSYDSVAMERYIAKREPIEHVRYIKADRGYFIREEKIRWAKHIRGEAFYVCSNMCGCSLVDTLDVSKDKNPESYEYLLKLFGIEEDGLKDGVNRTSIKSVFFSWGKPHPPS